MEKPKIAILSETIIGYGSPQVPTFATALAEHYGVKPVVYGPFHEIGPKRELYPLIDIQIISLKTPAWKPLGRAEYMIKLADKLNKLQPEIIVAFCTYTLPALKRLKYKPKKIIYYSLETLSNYQQREVFLNRNLANLFDVVIYPEFNRAALDGGKCLLLNRPVVMMYNSVHRKACADSVLPAGQRNGRIIHPGSIAYEVTFAGYFLDERSSRYPLDIYGIVYGEELKKAVADMTGNVRYLGIVDEKTLAEVRRDYSWGIVTWNPDTENGRLAAPNKLFDYISSGVPIIAAPHPQAVELIKKYGCGLVMPDWSYESFLWTIEEALKISKSEHYKQYVDGCIRALKEEVSWDDQFGKFLAIFEGDSVQPPS